MTLLRTATHTRLNTLSVPTITTPPAASACVACIGLLLCLATVPALAGTQHYQAPLDNVRWEASSAKLHCTLKHEIPLYGEATFTQSAGEKLRFTLKVKRQASRNKDSAQLRSLPPEWKHQIPVVDLGSVPVIKGDTPFRLEEGLSRRMLAELQKGMFPTFSYRDWADARDQVSVALPGIHIKAALDEFISCLDQLPDYRFADVENTLLHFEFGRHTLSAEDRSRLDAVARYIKSDPGIKRVEVYGHTDSVGGKGSNDKLGERRSLAARQYLIDQGAAAALFTLKSFGERQPKASNNTDQGRAANRRAAVILVK
ncbi:MAG: OmpA family protein [Gammaproteobacteria bacterium]|nr:OmpA family protein [Gammaproteobacteria bacterium]